MVVRVVPLTERNNTLAGSAEQDQSDLALHTPQNKSMMVHRRIRIKIDKMTMECDMYRSRPNYMHNSFEYKGTGTYIQILFTKMNQFPNFSNFPLT